MSGKPTTLAEALVAFQANAPQITKSKTVEIKTPKGKFSYAYAPHEAIAEAIKEPLAGVGLAVSQLLGCTPNGLPAVRTILMHESGERLEDWFPLPVHNGSTPQEIGGIVTYVRRYALCGVLGLVTEEDDDANHATAQAKQAKPQESPFQQPAAAVKPDAEAKRLKAELLKLVPQHKDLIEKHASDKEWLGRQIETAKANAK